MTEEAKKIVKALRMCHDPKYGCYDCPVDVPGEPCQNELKAADLIESLSAQLEQVTRERDAAVEALRDAACCADCKNYATQMYSEPCKTCLMCPSQSKPNWQWHGVEVIDDA